MEFPLPTQEARAHIMRIHSRKMNVSQDVNYDELARCTEDFNGAQCKAVCVEAVSDGEGGRGGREREGKRGRERGRGGRERREERRRKRERGREEGKYTECMCDSYQVHVLLWYHHTLLLLRVYVCPIH